MAVQKAPTGPTGPSKAGSYFSNKAGQQAVTPVAPTPTTTVPKASGYFSNKAGVVQTTTPTTIPAYTKEIQDIGIDPSIYAKALRLAAQSATQMSPKDEQGFTDIALGKVQSGLGLVNSVINFKIPGTGIRPGYLPFYPIDKLLEVENMIPGLINQVQNALEGKPVDVGSFTDPFGKKGIVSELGRTLTEQPRQTELFKASQEQKGYSQVVDNPALALTLDIALAPTTYLSGGGAGISKGLLKAIATGGAKKAFSETGEALTKNAAKQLVKQAAADVAKKSFDDIVAKGVVGIERDAAEFAAKKAANNAAKAVAKVTAEEASEDVLIKAITDYAGDAATAARRGVTGARSSADMAADLIDAKNVAIRTLEDADAGLIPALSAKNRTATESLIANLTDEVISDIGSKGYRGFQQTEAGMQVAGQLGVRPGIRWGVGSQKVFLPGSERLSNAFGGVLDAGKSQIAKIPGAVETTNFLLKTFTPQGRGGLLGEADLRDLRYNIRAGNLTGKELENGLLTLRLDRQVRSATAATKEGLGVTVGAIDEFAKADKAYATTVHELIENPRINLLTDSPATVSAKLGRTISEGELDLARRAQISLDQSYKYSDSIYKNLQLNAGVKFEDLQSLPRQSNFFPHVLTEKATFELAKNKKLAAELGADLTSLPRLTAARTLVAGSKVGTYTVTASDIAKGVGRLNEIYKRYGGLTYDLFETDIGLAVSKHINNISSDLGRMRAFEGAIAEGRLLRAKPSTAIARAPELGDLDAALDFYLTPQKITAINTIPEAQKDLDNIIYYLDELETLTTAKSKVALGNDVERASRNINNALRALDGKVGTVPMSASITLEAQALSDDLAEQARNILTNVTSRSVDDWKIMKPLLDDGFVALNEKVLPNIQAQQELAMMLSNARRFEDPKFVVAMNQYMTKINRYFKSWVTATPGFHTRNTISNGFFMAVAGANPKYVENAADIYNKWLTYVKNAKGTIRAETRGAIDEGFVDIIGSFDPSDAIFIDDFVDKAYPTISFAEREALIGALDNLTAAGFGRTAEVFEGGVAGLGRTTGVTGAGSAQNIVSQALGKPLYISRETGTMIENYSRFALTYDGLRKGLNGEQAAARTAKFLVDYQDIARADELIKQIIPFWMWMSRALPLMIKQMWTNPKAFVIYEKIKAGVKDEDGELVIPGWMQRQGAFKAPFGGNITLMPDLGFTGLGEDVGNLTDLVGLAGMSNPVIKGTIEALTNYDTFKRDKYRDPQYYTEAEIAKDNLIKFAKNLAVIPGVAQRYGRALAAAIETGNVGSNAQADAVANIIRQITQTNPPDYLQEQGVLEPTQDQNINALTGFLGIPARAVPAYEQERETKLRLEQMEKLLQQRAQR